MLDNLKCLLLKSHTVISAQNLSSVILNITITVLHRKEVSMTLLEPLVLGQEQCGFQVENIGMFHAEL